ncbi:MAG: cupin domain-containing protein [Chloroflexota bacterium]
MSYDGEGTTEAVPVLAHDAEAVRLGSGAQARFIAPGSLTDGRYGLFRWDAPARSGGAKPHFHRTFSEAFYVLSGEMEVWAGATWQRARAGDFLFIPEGGIHGFRNDGDADASMLILFAPGAPREQYFMELAGVASTGRTLTAEEWAELYARHDQYMA